MELSDFFKFNPFDNKNSTEFLKFLPETNKTENGEIVDVKDEFWKLFYYDNTDVLEGTTKELIDNIKESNVDFIIFKGPSGSGKTTYLQKIIKDREKYFVEGFPVIPFFDVVNLIEHPYKSATDPSLFRYALLNKILYVINPLIVKAIYKAIKEGDKYRPLEGQRVRELIDSFSDFKDALAKCNRLNSDGSIRKIICDFIGSVKKISDIIAYYFIFYIFKYCLKDKKGMYSKPVVFVFDNMDELEFSYLAKNIASEFCDAFSQAQEVFNLFKGTNTITGNYDFITNCTIIESVREGFVADSNTRQFVSACQQLDREDILTTNIQFEINYKDVTYNIAKRRFDLYRHFKENEGKGLPNVWFENGQLLVTEKRQIYNLSDLFNNDYRMTLSCLSGALTEDLSAWKKIAEDDRDCIIGVRGFLLFHILKALYKRGNTAFREYISAELNDKSCNKNRMFMSLLANNNGMKKGGTDGLNSLEDKKISLREFTERVKGWYADTDVSNIYEAVFASNNHNYSILASLEGEKIDDYFKSNNDEISLIRLCEFLSNKFNTNPDDLNTVKIVVHPVCRAYTEEVFINFEYFNLISINKRELYRAKSLFQYDSFDDVKSCLSRVYGITKDIVRKADQYVCDRCNTCISNPENKETMCTRQIQKLNNEGFLINNSLYKTRVISSHINYLDSFRKMMWLKCHENDKEMYEKFNTLILDYISYYINNLYENGVMDKSELFTGISNRYEKAKSIGCREWSPILIGLKTQDLDKQ